MRTRLAAHRQHAVYLTAHKYYVFLAGRALEVPLHQLVIHDWSKLTPAQWFPYTNYFYPPTPEARPPEVHEAFWLAWKLHQNEKHHWQRWVVIGDDGSLRPIEMPKKYVREMVADWWGAGAVRGMFNSLDWYMARRDKIILYPSSRIEAESCLERLRIKGFLHR